MNNLKVLSIADVQFDEYFGFTDEEVRDVLDWSNTSSNEAVRRFIRESDKVTLRREIERLVAGEVIEKEIHQQLVILL